MDDYTRKTVKLLLERDRAYLSELVGQPIHKDTTVDEVCEIIADQNKADTTSHASSIYKCRCGSNLVVVREVQLRSADEGSTIVHICKSCGHKW